MVPGLGTHDSFSPYNTKDRSGMGRTDHDAGTTVAASRPARPSRAERAEAAKARRAVSSVALLDLPTERNLRPITPRPSPRPAGTDNGGVVVTNVSPNGVPRPAVSPERLNAPTVFLSTPTNGSSAAKRTNGVNGADRTNGSSGPTNGTDLTKRASDGDAVDDGAEPKASVYGEFPPSGAGAARSVSWANGSAPTDREPAGTGSTAAADPAPTGADTDRDAGQDVEDDEYAAAERGATTTPDVSRPQDKDD
jgi:hypothetical protein